MYIHSVRKALVASAVALAVALTAGAETFDLKGQVLDADGKPVADAQVYCCAISARTWMSGRVTVRKEARTDANGGFLFTLEKPGPQGAHVLYAHRDGMAWGGGLIQGAREETREMKIVLLAPAEVTGRVTTADGAPISGAEVRPYVRVTAQRREMMWVSVPGLPFLNATTDAEGVFTLRDLPQGAQCMLMATASGHAGAMFPDSRRMRTTSWLAIPSSDAVIVMEPGVAVRGTVLNEQTKKPVANVAVMIASRRGGLPTTAVTDADGAFAMDGVSAGEVIVAVPEGGILTSTPSLVLTAGQTETLTLTVSDGVQVTGRVVDAKTGQPVAGVHVQLSRAGGSERAVPQVAQTDDKGVFKLRAVAGAHTLFTHHDGYQPIQQQSVSIGEEPEPRLEDIKLTPVARIKLQAQDSDGKAVADAALLRHNRVFRNADKEGRLEIEAADPNRGQMLLEYVLKSPDGALAAVVPALTETVEMVVIKLLPTGGVTGIVQDSDGRPLVGADVQPLLIRQQERGYTSSNYGEPVKTDAQGKYTVAGLISGEEFGVQASKDGYGQNSPWESKRAVAAGIVHEADPIVLQTATAVLTGRIEDPAGNPVPNVEISLYGRANRHQQLRSDTDGRFRATQLVAEEVNLNLHGDAYANTYVTVPPDQFENYKFVVYPKPDPNAALKPGDTAADLAGVQPVQGEWKGFATAKGKRIVVAFVSIKNRACRRALQVIEAAVASDPQHLTGVIVHDASAPVEAIRAYLTENKIALPVVRVEGETQDGWYAPAFLAYKVVSVPTVFLIGAGGKVAQSGVPLEELAAVLGGAKDP